MPGPQITDASADEVRVLAKEILERAEYARHRRDPTFLQNWIDTVATWLENAWNAAAKLMPDWVIAVWDGLWPGFVDLIGTVFGNDALTVLVRLTLAVAVFAAIGLLVHHTLRELRARPEDETSDDDDAPGARGPSLIQDAERNAREGHFLEAAHCTQLAVLQALLRKKCLELERSDPNRVLRRRLVEAPLPGALRDRFLLLLDRLEGQWFRDRGEDRDLYGAWRSLHAEVEALPDFR